MLGKITDVQVVQYDILVSSRREQATHQVINHTEPGTDYNTIGKITDVRVVRYDILVSSSKGASSTTESKHTELDTDYNTN